MSKNGIIEKRIIKRKGKIMCKAAEIGKIIVNKCLEKKIFINTQKLQKLLVLMNIECVIETGNTLFNEDIVIWDCGVAIKEVDKEFKQYILEFTEPLVEYIVLLEQENQIIENVLEMYGGLCASDINKLDIIATLINKYKSLDKKHITKYDILMEYNNAS